jgi:hypothetical protein
LRRLRRWGFCEGNRSRFSHTASTLWKQIATAYKADVAIELHRAGQLGLDYKSQVASLTNSPSVSDIASSVNFYFGTITETKPGRQILNTTASTAVASLAEISYATSPNVDRTGYWHYNSSYWTDANRFHPDPRFFSLPTYDYTNMFYCPGGYSNCANDVSRNAAALVMGYDPRMDPSEDDDPYGPLENPTVWRSEGLTYSGPNLQYYLQQGYTDLDYWNRVDTSFQLVADFLNPIFYQWDGLNTLAVKNSISMGNAANWYLPNPYVDSIPTMIGWNDVNYNGFCYTAGSFTGDTCREDNSFSCSWGWNNS